MTYPLFHARSPRRYRRGFGVAPILYVIGLIGVASGILFSNYMQSFVQTMKIQNGLTVRNDLMGASASLAAQSVFSADNTTLCPPRSVHQTTGDPCAAAPVGLIQFQDFPNTQRLPTGYANVGSTGLPTEVGVFNVGTNKQLDSYGHTYIYCRWENTRATPAAPAFVLISAGADGILQTTCGDTVAQGDNYMISFPVAEAITHASLWQPDGTTSVSYGATGTQVTVDAGGDLTAAGAISAASAAITNGITAATLTTTGDITAKDFVGSGTISGSLGLFGTLNASSAAITNGITAATLTTSGDISGLDLSVSGTVSGNIGNFVTLNASSAAITNGITATSLTASGAIIGASGTFTTLNGTNATITNNLTAANITASGVVTGATGTFTTLSATNATVTGNSNLAATTVSSLTNTGNDSVGGTLSVTGATNGSNATYTGTVTAANFNGAFSGSYSGSTVTTTGAASRNSLSVANNTIIGGALGVSGYTTLAGVTTSSVTNNGNLSVSGTSNLSGNLGIGCGGANNAVALVVCSNNLAPIAYFSQAASDGIIGINSTQSGGGSYIVFDENYNDYWALGKQEDQYGSSFYIWDYANRKNLLLGLYPSGNLQLGEAGTTFITANGNVGIGTSSPAGMLDVEGGTAAASTAGTSIKLVAQNAGTGNVNGGNIYLTTGTGSGTGYAGAVLIGSGCSGASWLANGLCAMGDIYSFTGFATPNYQAYGWGTSTANISGVGSGSASDQIRFITNSVERGRFDGSGHFGFATTSPKNTLDVSGAVAIGASYAGTSTSPANGLIVQGNVGVGTSNPSQPLSVVGNASISNQLTVGQILMPATGANYLSATGAGGAFVFQPNDTTAVAISGTGIAIGAGYANIVTPPTNGVIIQGNVGIGTTSPQAVLDVTGNGNGSFPNSNGSLSQFSILNGNYWATVFQDLSNSNRNYDIGISSWGTSDGKLGIVQVNSLEGITFIPAAVAGKNADDVLAINANLEVVNTAWSSVYLFVNDVTGNTGLGTSSPASTLSVKGGVAIGTTYAAANAAAANNLIVQGNVGIGTVTPAATLDVNGTLHLKEYGAAPAACSASQDGVIALTALYTLCVCKNGTGWVTAATGSTSCTW